MGGDLTPTSLPTSILPVPALGMVDRILDGHFVAGRKDRLAAQSADGIGRLLLGHPVDLARRKRRPRMREALGVGGQARCQRVGRLVRLSEAQWEAPEDYQREEGRVLF